MIFERGKKVDKKSGNSILEVFSGSGLDVMGGMVSVKESRGKP